MELIAHNLTKRYGGLTAVDGVDFSVSTGERVGLVGGNGAGKTTLFDLMTGFEKPQEGSLLLREGAKSIRLEKKPAYLFPRLGILRSFQQIRLYEERTVYDNIRLSQMGCAASLSDCDELIHQMGVFPLVSQKVSALSYGQRRLVEITRALAGGAKILFLDEPAAGMSMEEAENLAAILCRCQKGRSLGMVVIEHNLEFIRRFCGRIYLMEQGKVVAQGETGLVLESAAAARVLFA